MARLFLSPPHLSGAELDLLRDAVESNWIAPLGPHVDAFEAELAAATGAHSVLALSSGTAALHLALLVHGIGAGDEVACSTLTFAASANPIVYSGAQPFFVDSDDSWLIDPSLLDEAIVARKRAGGRVRAVIAVDLYGRCCDYDALADVCARHDVILIQDATESLGATYRGERSGSQAPLAALSFNGNKIITTSGGGALAGERRRAPRSRAEALHAGPRAGTALRAHRDRLQLPPQQPPGCGWPGAARGSAGASGGAAANQRPLSRASRRRAGIEFMPASSDGTSNGWLTCITVDPGSFGADREQIRLALEAEDIEARPVWKPMHLQPVFADSPIYGGDVSARLFERGLCLPSGSAMSDDDQRPRRRHPAGDA